MLQETAPEEGALQFARRRVCLYQKRLGQSTPSSSFYVRVLFDTALSHRV
jgi:hypothetical protein